MAKPNDAPEVPPEVPAKAQPEVPAKAQPEVPAKAQPVTYTFRKNGTNRTWEIDADHVDIMRTRNDLTYIGTVPLPPVKNQGGLTRKGE